MRLFITVGYEENSNRPHLVYLSEDGAQQKQVAAASPYPRLLHFFNPQGGIRKVNLAAAANAARQSEVLDSISAAHSEREQALIGRETALADRIVALEADWNKACVALDEREKSIAEREQAITARELAPPVAAPAESITLTAAEEVAPPETKTTKRSGK